MARNVVLSSHDEEGKEWDLDRALLLALVRETLFTTELLFFLVNVARVGTGVLLLASKVALFTLPARELSIGGPVSREEPRGKSPGNAGKLTHACSLLGQAFDAVCYRLGCLLDARCPCRYGVVTADGFALGKENRHG